MGGQAGVGQVGVQLGVQLGVQSSAETLLGSVGTQVFEKRRELPLLIRGESKHVRQGSNQGCGPAGCSVGCGLEQVRADGNHRWSVCITRRVVDGPWTGDTGCERNRWSNRSRYGQLQPTNAQKSIHEGARCAHKLAQRGALRGLAMVLGRGSWAGHVMDPANRGQGAPLTEVLGAVRSTGAE